MTSTEHIKDVVRHADEILARCGLPTYTARCDQLALLAEAAVRDNGKLEAEIHRLETRIIELIHNQEERKAATKLAESYKIRSARGWRS